MPHVVAALLVAMLLAGVARPDTAGAVTLPPGFDDRPVASMVRPVAIAFLPDDTMLVASLLGQVKTYRNGVLSAGDALDLTPKLCIDYERGLLAMTVDPQFESNRYVYLYYSFNKSGSCGVGADAAVNRVSRFVMEPDYTIDPDSEVPLIDNIPSIEGRHNGGDLKFGPDGLLYVSTGDGACDYLADSGCMNLNDASRDHNVLLGKILRIERNGAIPPGNPFQGEDTARCWKTGITEPGKWCRETFAWGLRNPFRISFDPDSSEPRFFINDVGESYWEEIDLGVEGADYGWNLREGPCANSSDTWCPPPPPDITDPIYAYPHTSECSSNVGGDFVPAGAWAPEYDGDYIFMDFVCGKAFKLSEGADGAFTSSLFADAFDGYALITATFGPDLGHGDGASLYYASWATHQVRRISHTANRAPIARVAADPAHGSAPLDVVLGSQSYDPDGDPITREWDFGDGTTATGETELDHRYQDVGTYTATLTVRDDQGAEDTATVRIDAGNTPPVPVIETPVAGHEFGVGETIALSGSAEDSEDGTLDESNLTWTVDRHHDNHKHPFLPPTAGSTGSVLGPAPEGLDATMTGYLEVSLTATDSDGLSATVTRNVHPRLVDVTFRSEPTGALLELDGRDHTTPVTVRSWEGWELDVNAPSQRDQLDRGLVFVSWSDGGAAHHKIVTPASPSTRTAGFTPFYVRPKGASPIRMSLVPAYRPCVEPNRVHGPPLASASCAPPAPPSSSLTVGTVDANGLGAQSTGEVLLVVAPGSPAIPGDQADVRLSMRMTDVRRKSNLADYTGSVWLDLSLRITDRAHATPADDPATLTPAGIGVAVPCMTTSGPEGARCELHTTIDAVSPGSVPEGARSIWEVGAVRVFDGGADDDAATQPNSLFATQGVFVP